MVVRMVKSSQTKKNVNGNSGNTTDTKSSKASIGPDSHSSSKASEKLKEHQQNFAKSAKEAFEKISKHAKDVKVDHKTLIEGHKKNLKVLNETNKKAAEVMKSVSALQSQFAKQTFEDLNMMMRNMMTKKAGKPIDPREHAETLKNSFQRAVDHAQHVSSLLSKSGKEIHANLHERLEEGKEEVKAHMAKHQTTHH